MTGEAAPVIDCAAAMRIIVAIKRSTARMPRGASSFRLGNGTLRNHLHRRDGRGLQRRRRPARPPQGVSEPCARRPGRVPLLLPPLCQPCDLRAERRPAEARRRASRKGATSESRYAWTKSKSQPSRLIRKARWFRAVGPPSLPTARSAAPHHVFLIDGSGFIFRAYFARRAARTGISAEVGRHGHRRS